VITMARQSTNTIIEDNDISEMFITFLDPISHSDGPHPATDDELYQLRALIYRYIHCHEIACSEISVLKAKCGKRHILVSLCELSEDDEFKSSLTK
jgi:hypothetical protein